MQLMAQLAWAPSSGSVHKPGKRRNGVITQPGSDLADRQAGIFQEKLSLPQQLTALVFAKGHLLARAHRLLDRMASHSHHTRYSGNLDTWIGQHKGFQFPYDGPGIVCHGCTPVFLWTDRLTALLAGQAVVGKLQTFAALKIICATVMAFLPDPVSS
jgi:hypothetical protein